MREIKFAKYSYPWWKRRLKRNWIIVCLIAFFLILGIGATVDVAMYTLFLVWIFALPLGLNTIEDDCGKEDYSEYLYRIIYKEKRRCDRQRKWLM